MRRTARARGGGAGAGSWRGWGRGSVPAWRTASLRARQVARVAAEVMGTLSLADPFSPPSGGAARRGSPSPGTPLTPGGLGPGWGRCGPPPGLAVARGEHAGAAAVAFLGPAP